MMTSNYTHSTMQNWLRSLALLVAFAASLAGSTAAAQGTSNAEAFYIYQNDGHFDGFFYDEVKEMRYSRTDTMGVEHEDYVSQEIVTNDSTYRIMLTAIDSVSFVQPEVKFAKGVRFMQDEGMLDYFLLYLNDEELGKIMAFSITMPTALRPKVGDVLVCRDLEGHDGMFVAKVAQVEYADDLIAVRTEFIENLDDVFEQFVGVEEVHKENTTLGARSWSRSTNPSKGTAWEGNIDDITLFNFSTSLEGKLSFGKISLGFQASVGFGMTAKATYNIGLSKFYIKTELKEQIAAGFGVVLDGELYNKLSMRSLPGVGALIDRFSKIPFPASFPILYATVTPEPFTRAEAHLNLNLSTGVAVKSLVQSFEIKDKWPYINVKMGFLPYPILPLTFEPSANWSISAQLNGMVQTGMKFPIEVGTEHWMQKLLDLKLSATLYAGPKITGVLNNEFIHGNNDDGPYNVDKGTYESMKDSKIDLTLMSLDEEFVGTGKVWGAGVELKKVVSAAYFNYPLKLFADISDAKYEITGEKMNTVTAKYSTGGDVFLPQQLGFALYKKENNDDQDFKSLYRYALRHEPYFLNTFNSVDLMIENVEPGVYKVRPIVSCPFGDIPVYGEEQDITITSQEVELKPDEITAEEDGGDFNIEILNSLDGDFVAVTYDDWVEAEIVKDNSSLDSKAKMLKVKVKPNEMEKYRTTTVVVRQTIGTDMKEKTLTVKQYGGLELSTYALNIKKEGSDNTVSILTSMSPITINLNGNEDWVGYELDGRTLYLHFSENTGATRVAKITVAAWNARTQGISTVTLTVRQEGAVDATLSASELTFDANGGTKQVTVTVGEGTTFTGASIADSDKEWLIIEKGNGYCNITAMPNTTALQRTGTAYCEVTNKDGQKMELPITITQEFGEASVTPEALAFDSNGGTQQVKINFGNYAYCGTYVGEDGKGWIEAVPESDGTVNITVQPNATIVQRVGTVYCWVSGVKSPTDEQMMKLPVSITQDPTSALEPVTPDGDKTPFKHINFTSLRKVYYVSANEGTSEEPVDLWQGFNFKAENSQFKVTYGKTINHYECKGYAETGKTRQSATLSFDLDKRDNKVKNLRFRSNTESVYDMHIMGYDTHTVNYTASSMSLNNLKFDINTYSYKDGKTTTAEGLTFNTFSCTLDTRTTYTSTLYPYDLPSASADHVTYVPVNANDSAYIVIAYKDGQGEPIEVEWPSNEVMSSLKAAGMPINEGTTPPAISGTYHATPLTIVSDPTGEGAAEFGESGTDGMVIKFVPLENGQVLVDLYGTRGGTPTEAMDVMQGIVEGSGNKFSSCVPLGDGSAIIISGEIVDGAINDLYFATCSMNTAGEHLILKDQDGSSSSTTWAPGKYEFEE